MSNGNNSFFSEFSPFLMLLVRSYGWYDNVPSYSDLWCEQGHRLVAMATGIMQGAILLNLLDQYQYLLQNISSFAMTLIE